ncbi:hypothetical protein VaNZ11_012965 [Volvox africanus]|uniref:Thioredoxin domain-containing protein n=1 Tax=Volvox africanus TaxID=51714 RepID=A0ABQ5SGC4_9CHLO|nr:hypothetical protein VaNZ11_012965 [Volvox africanus]
MAYNAVLSLLLLAGLIVPAVAGKAVVELTDDNFDAKTSSGVWMIKVYAPWCIHCRQLEPLWQAFADEAEVDGVLVAKVNGDKERYLMSRLRVTGFPTIFLLRDGNTYEYNGPRNVDSFRTFATSGYKKSTAKPFYLAPNSIVGRAIGQLYGVPRLFRSVYRLLHEKHGLSDAAIILGFLAIPVAVGGVLICCLDALFVQRAKEEFGPEHEHQE